MSTVKVAETTTNFSIRTSNVLGQRTDADALPSVVGVTLYLADGTAIAQDPAVVTTVTQKQDPTPANLTGLYNVQVDLTAFLDAVDAAYTLQAEEEIQVDVDATINLRTVSTTKTITVVARPLEEGTPSIVAA